MAYQNNPPYGQQPMQNNQNGFQPYGVNQENHQYNGNYQNNFNNTQAFSHNAAYNGSFQNPNGFPPFSAAAVASGVPPLPIYSSSFGEATSNGGFGNPFSGWQAPPITTVPQPQNSFVAYDPSANSNFQPRPASIPQPQQSAAPWPSKYPAPAVPPLGQNRMFAPAPPPASLGPRAMKQSIEEGELSEGEYRETPIKPQPKSRERNKRSREAELWNQMHSSQRNADGFQDRRGPAFEPRRQDSQREDISMPDYSYRSADAQPYSPRQASGGPNIIRQSSYIQPQGRRPSTSGAHGRPKVDKKSNQSKGTTHNGNQRPQSRHSSSQDEAVSRIEDEHPMVHEARKQAQNAVLNLHPLKVRFDDYIEEYIDATIVKKVFADVGIILTVDGVRKAEDRINMQSSHAPKPTLPTKPVTPTQPALSLAILPAKPPCTALIQATVTTSEKTNENTGALGNRKPSVSTTTTAGDKLEERRDKIARLLEARKTGTSTATPTTTAVTPPAPITTAYNKAEERKDRIARMLAEKNQKSAKVPSAFAASAAPVAPVEVPIALVALPAPSAPGIPNLATPIAPSATNTIKTPVALAQPAITKASEVSAAPTEVDKSALLKQKLEALQKARKAQAEKYQPEAKQATPPAALLNYTSNSPFNALPPRPAVTVAPFGQSEPGPQFSQYAQADASNKGIKSFFNPHFGGFGSIPGISMPPMSSMPPIPGLFLAAQAPPGQSQSPSQTRAQASQTPQPAAQAPVPPVQTSATVINARKRPLASDFESSLPTQPAYKKPFGHTRNDECIIDVSDDSSSDDSEHDENATDFNAKSKENFARSVSTTGPLKASPQISRSYTVPNSAVNTPPFSHQPARPEDLRKKESEIEQLKRKIAEMEQKKKAVSAAISQVSTPKSPKTAQTSSRESSSAGDRVETSMAIEQLMDEANRKIKEDQAKMAAVQLLDEQHSQALKSSEEKQRRQRYAQLAADVPLVDADFGEKRKRLAALRAEMQKIEDDVQKKLDDKRRLAEEMEKLNIEADTQLQAKKEQLQHLSKEVANSEQVAPVTVSESADTGFVAAPAQVPADAIAQASKEEAAPIPQSDGGRDVEGTSPSEVAVPLVAEVSVLDTVNVLSDILTVEQPLEPGALMTDAQSSQNVTSNSPAQGEGGVSSSEDEEDQAMVESSVERTSESVDRAMSAKDDSSSSEDEDEKMPDARSEASAAMDIDRRSSIVEQPVDDTSSEDSSSSSDESSDSDDDSEAEETNQDTDIMKAQQDRIAVESDEDYYDPPEASALDTRDTTNLAASAPAVKASITPDVVNVPQAPAPRPPSFAPEAAKPAQASSTVALATPTEAISANGSTATSAAPRLAGPTFFTPYQSPLKQFHAFRFHPLFTKEVPGGYKSLTFSNNIDPQAEFCRYELAGGICNDRSCDMQHFRDISVNDSQILEVLGNPLGMKEEDKLRYIKGLQRVLQDLRKANVRDFEAIAERIVEFRQTLYDGNSRILPLDG